MIGAEQNHQLALVIGRYLTDPKPTFKMRRVIGV